MNQNWKDFLQQNGAEFIVNSAGNSSQPETSEIISFDVENESQLSPQKLLLINPSERGLLKVTGEDAESFLQNQFTNDIRNVTENNYQLSAWCSPKGRIIATFRIFKRDGAFYLALSRDLIEHVIKKLRMYVMMSKVVIEDVTDTVIHFSFSGREADKHLEEFTGLNHTQNHEVIHHNSLSILYTADELNKVFRFDIFIDTDGAEEAKQLWTQIKEIATTLGDNGLDLLNIAAGLPEISAKSSEDWIPQMVNYIQVGGVDFKKGCYPGQEVVARLNYLGKTKRRMYRIEINTNELPTIGDAIKSESDNKAGTVLNAVLNENAKVYALAVLKIASVTDSLSLMGSDVAISVLDLPYIVED